MPPRKGPWHNARADRQYRAINRLLPRLKAPREEPLRLPIAPSQSTAKDATPVTTAPGV
jgi:hypothetical protein